ncbi:hypothetical protein F4Y59_10895 [Candidatus Poribacteria bacterium]|nr:hypothetical protein [Candidatus Poribacteria bacterium]MYK19605.1 hypothetical protein [Candidatus Poribacteria bacterium]
MRRAFLTSSVLHPSDIVDFICPNSEHFWADPAQSGAVVEDWMVGSLDGFGFHIPTFHASTLPSDHISPLKARNWHDICLGYT